MTHTPRSSTVTLYQELGLETGKKCKRTDWKLDNAEDARNDIWSILVHAATKTITVHNDDLRDGSPDSLDSHEWKKLSATLSAPIAAVTFRIGPRSCRGTPYGEAGYYANMETRQGKCILEH